MTLLKCSHYCHFKNVGGISAAICLNAGRLELENALKTHLFSLQVIRREELLKPTLNKNWKYGKNKNQDVVRDISNEEPEITSSLIKWSSTNKWSGLV